MSRGQDLSQIRHGAQCSRIPAPIRPPVRRGAVSRHAGQAQGSPRSPQSRMTHPGLACWPERFGVGGWKVLRKMGYDRKIPKRHLGPVDTRPPIVSPYPLRTPGMGDIPLAGADSHEQIPIPSHRPHAAAHRAPLSLRGRRPRRRQPPRPRADLHRCARPGTTCSPALASGTRCSSASGTGPGRAFSTGSSRPCRTCSTANPSASTAPSSRPTPRRSAARRPRIAWHRGSDSGQTEPPTPPGA